MFARKPARSFDASRGFRDRGNLAQGVTVAGKVRLRLEHRQVDTRSVLQWLDPGVPDDGLWLQRFACKATIRPEW